MALQAIAMSSYRVKGTPIHVHVTSAHDSLGVPNLTVLLYMAIRFPRKDYLVEFTITTTKIQKVDPEMPMLRFKGFYSTYNRHTKKDLKIFMSFTTTIDMLKGHYHYHYTSGTQVSLNDKLWHIRGQIICSEYCPIGVLTTSYSDKISLSLIVYALT